VKGIIVQKFGGTSVGTPEAIAAAIGKVQEALKGGFLPVVVVSAMGRRGAAYATDTLAGLISPEGKEDWLRDRDLLMSCGEVISAAVFADALRSCGHKAGILTGRQAGIETDTAYGHGQCIRIRPLRIHSMLEQGIVPVVTGFQGASCDGEIVTLGRGGSDTTAALLGSALKAERVEIFTDVNGIMTADPRVVDTAHVLREVSYNDVFQMADQGANVIHPRAVEIAQQAEVDMVVRNTFSDDPGTHICAAVTQKPSRNPAQLISAVTRISGRTQLRVKDAQQEQQNALLQELAGKGISVDLINLGAEHCAVTMDAEHTAAATNIAESLSLHFSVETDCAKVSVIGSGMRGQPGVMSRVLSTLMEEKIALLQTTDSHTTISCLVPGYQSESAMRALHRAFGLDDMKDE